MAVAVAEAAGWGAMLHPVHTQEAEALAPTTPSAARPCAMPEEAEAEDTLDTALMEDLPPAGAVQEARLALVQTPLPVPAVAAAELRMGTTIMVETEARA